jgi:hypothetical protein
VLPFTQWAVVLAIVFVAAPFYLRWRDRGVRGGRPLAHGRRPGRSAPGPAGRSSGWPCRWPRAAWWRAGRSPSRGDRRVRATVMFAGNVLGETQTFPLAIYEQFDTDFDVALGDRHPARRAQRRHPRPLQGDPGPPVAPPTLELDIAVDRRSLRLAVALTLAGETLALAGPSAQASRRSCGRWPGCCVRARAASPSTAGRGSTPPRRIDLPPEHRSVGSCSRSTRSSPISASAATWPSACGGGGRARVDAVPRPPGHQTARRRAAGAPVRRRAATRGAGAGAGPRPGRAPARRAAGGARRPDARGRPRRARGPPRGARAPDDRGHARLDGRGRARPPDVRAGRRAARQTGTPAELVAAPGDASWPRSRAGTDARRGPPAGARRDRRRAAAGGALLSTDVASGPVGVAVYPWEVELCPRRRRDRTSCSGGSPP